jgi:hypothetical protein
LLCGLVLLNGGLCRLQGALLVALYLAYVAAAVVIASG